MHNRTSGVNCKKKQLTSIQYRNTCKIIEIHAKDNRSLWELFKEFYNSIDIDQLFTRKEMFLGTYDRESAAAMRSQPTTTVDVYRCCLKNLGMLELIKPGTYKKKMHLPKSVTISKIHKMSKDNKGWKAWFVPLHEQFGVDESEIK